MTQQTIEYPARRRRPAGMNHPLARSRTEAFLRLTSAAGFLTDGHDLSVEERAILVRQRDLALRELRAISGCMRPIPPKLKFDRTRAALAVLDRAVDGFDNVHPEASLAAIEAAENALGEAFADDTPQNRREDAVSCVRYPAGMEFIRKAAGQ